MSHNGVRPKKQKGVRPKNQKGVKQRNPKGVLPGSNQPLILPKSKGVLPTQSITSIIFKKAVDPKTRISYKRQWTEFKKFAQLSNQAALPATSNLIAAFIIKLSQKLSPNTIRTYLAAIAFYHKLINENNPCAVPFIKDLVKALSKLGPHKSRLRKPIKFKLLKKLLNHLTTTMPGYNSILFKAALSVQFHGCMRAGEVVVSSSDKHTIKLKQVSVRHNCLIITLKSYKHKNNTRERILLKKLPKKLAKFCPVRLVKQYIHIRSSKSNSKSLFLNEDNSPLTRVQLSAALKEALSSVGKNPHKYNTHSLRSGRATQLLDNHCPIDIIRKFGRWHSDAFKNYLQHGLIQLPEHLY